MNSCTTGVHFSLLSTFPHAMWGHRLKRNSKQVPRDKPDQPRRGSCEKQPLLQPLPSNTPPPSLPSLLSHTHPCPLHHTCGNRLFRGRKLQVIISSSKDERRELAMSTGVHPNPKMMGGPMGVGMGIGGRGPFGGNFGPGGMGGPMGPPMGGRGGPMGRGVGPMGGMGGGRGGGPMGGGPLLPGPGGPGMGGRGGTGGR